MGPTLVGACKVMHHQVKGGVLAFKIEELFSKLLAYFLLMDSEPWRHIPVVIWTGAISDQEVTRYYRAGANSLLLKQDAMQDVETFCRYWLKLTQLPQLVFSPYP